MSEKLSRDQFESEDLANLMQRLCTAAADHDSATLNEVEVQMIVSLCQHLTHRIQLLQSILAQPDECSGCEDCRCGHDAPGSEALH